MKSFRSSKMKLGAIAICAFALTSCTGDGPGDEEDLSTALSRGESFTVAEADCVAQKVFAEYGDNGDAIKAISNADDIAELKSGENAVEGFDQKFIEFQESCKGTEPVEEN